MSVDIRIDWLLELPDGTIVTNGSGDCFVCQTEDGARELLDKKRAVAEKLGLGAEFAAGAKLLMRPVLTVTLAPFGIASPTTFDDIIGAARAHMAVIASKAAREAGEPTVAAPAGSEANR